jgi:hypothetical protein
MCTVTFIPSGRSVFITHSRDESSIRPRALPPANYTVNDYTLSFPKDPKAGGTWLAINENANTGVLLNGGFTRHISNPPYRRSRGLVLLDIIASPDMVKAWQTINLSEIEPFTTVLWNSGELFETRWDGNNKHLRPLNRREGHIWSSTTLYDADMLSKRKSWFDNWLRQIPHPCLDDVIQFHLDGGDGDPNHDLCLNRDGCMLTVSITAMEIGPDKGIMRYLDMNDKSIYQHEISFTKSPVEI